MNHRIRSDTEAHAGPCPSTRRTPRAPQPAAASRRRLLLAGAGAFALAGCAAVEPSVYRAERPALDLKRFFDGTVDAWGIFQDRSGKVVRRFTVLMQCSWSGDVGTLDELFRYSDGTTGRRVWTLRRIGADLWSGIAEDVIGEATGAVAGNAFHWRYTLALPVDGRIWHVDMDDWMYLVDERVMLNRAVMSKFGVRLGKVTLAFTRRT
ncbi:MAG: DUF3833 domain-containing protein [Burkholderiales bacterium]|nr:MAG: DUF3833 domain-containing protein [Burkholderiales bacterium]